MFKLLFSFSVIIFLSASFDGAYANKWDARESLTPTQPYHLYIPSPFQQTNKNPKVYKDPNSAQFQKNNNLRSRW